MHPEAECCGARHAGFDTIMIHTQFSVELETRGRGFAEIHTPESWQENESG